MSGWLDLASVANTSRQLEWVPGANTSGQFDLASKPIGLDGSTWHLKLMSGWLNVATGADTSGWLNLASVADMSGQLDLADRADTSGRLDLSAEADTSGQLDLAARSNTCRWLDLPPRADTSGWLDLDSSQYVWMT